MAQGIEEIADRLTAKAMAGVDLLDDHEANALMDALTPAERANVTALMEQRHAHSEERMEAGEVELAALEAALEVRKQLDSGEIDRPEAERRVRKIDHASDGAVSRHWDI